MCGSDICVTMCFIAGDYRSSSYHYYSCDKTSHFFGLVTADPDLMVSPPWHFCFNILAEGTQLIFYKWSLRMVVNAG